MGEATPAGREEWVKSASFFCERSGWEQSGRALCPAAGSCENHDTAHRAAAAHVGDEAPFGRGGAAS